MSTEKKYQLFISSTYTDLKEARQEVIKVILNMYHIPIGMEMFSADNEDQWDTIKETIDSSDYYILIIGHRYGSQTKEGISYTEKEFDYAKSTGVPIYAYIRERNIPTLEADRDNDQKVLRKLNAFIGKASANAMVEFWKEPVDLAQKIAVAMPKAFRKIPRVGWVKGDNAASAATINEIALLSKENRELKEELNNLKKTTDKIPKLKVLFNNEETIMVGIPQNFHTDKMLEKASYVYPESLNHEAYIYYTEQNVNGFNKWIEDNPEKVESYNKGVTSFELSKASVKEINLSIFNYGTAKANDINIQIYFPDQVLVINKDDMSKFDSYPYPENAPTSPLVLAKTIFKNKFKASKPRNTDYHINPDLKNLINLRDSVSSITFNNYRHISLNLKSLIHTGKYEDQEKFTLYLWPIISCNTSVKVDIICEEFSETQSIEIPFTIMEINNSNKSF